MELVASSGTIAVRDGGQEWLFDSERGYVRELIANGRYVVRDELRAGPDPHCPLHLNEPRAGGIGSFGCHVMRDGWSGETNTRMVSNADGWGSHLPRTTWLREGDGVTITHTCSLHDPWSELFRLTRRYRFRPEGYLLVELGVSELGAGGVYIKEPKLQLGACPPGGVSFALGTHYNRKGERLARKPLAEIADPWKGTWQLRSRRRCHLQLSPAMPGDTLGGLGFDRFSGPGMLHALGDLGFDYWHDDADKRPRRMGDCKGYCLQGPPAGTLTRAWEVAKRKLEPDVGFMLHAWEGGAGAGDCACAARLSKRASWRMRLVVSWGPGWTKSPLA